MSAAALSALITAITGLITAIFVGIHSINNRKRIKRIANVRQPLK